jgi:hypothetical protein
MLNNFETIKHKSKNLFSIDDPKIKNNSSLMEEKHLRKRQIESKQKFDKIIKKKLLRKQINPENEFIMNNIEQINPVILIYNIIINKNYIIYILISIKGIFIGKYLA